MLQIWSNKHETIVNTLYGSGPKFSDMIPETAENKDLKRIVLGIFEDLSVIVDPSNVEDCHWTKSSKGLKKVIVKLSRRKDANKIRLSKKV